MPGIIRRALQYLKAMEAAKSDKAEDVLAMMHKMPLDDMYARHAVLREDNLMVHDMLLARSKRPKKASARGITTRFSMSSPARRRFAR